MHGAIPAAGFEPATDSMKGPVTPLLPRLRDATRALHNRAEQSGVYHALLTGRAERAAYVLLLRNLEPVYRALERALVETQDWHFPVLPGLFRAAALERDLDKLAGPRWRHELALLPAARAYAEHLDRIAATAPVRLTAHVYTRYLGDLAGGQVLRRLVAARFELGSEALSYFDFAGDEDLSPRVRQLRMAIESVGSRAEAASAVIDEAVSAFRRTIAISEAVQHAAVAPSPSSGR